jgi:SWI/SNF-related matrix-associated actin-dependent regulator of chromatin subfamily A member 5
MKDIDSIIRLTDGKSIDAKSGFKYQVLRNLVMQLRKCCIHPFLFDGAEPDIDSTSLEEIIASSGKLAVLDKLLMSLFANKNRTVIFSQFTRMLDILEDYCIMRGWNYCRFDGGTARAKRNYLINKFNARDSDVFIFLMSTRSGGLGINLQTADTCILYDSDWNPQPDLQAMARVHRIGQKKVVHVYRLVSHGTVEERVLERAEKKLYLDQIVNSGASDGVNNEDNVGLTTAELLSTLRFGSNAVFSSTNELPNDNDIEHMTDRKRSENTSKGLLQGGTSKTAKDFEKDKALTSTTTLNGVDFKAIRESQGQDKKKKIQSITDLKKEWKTLNEGRGKREKTSRVLTVKVDGHKAVNILRTNNYELEHGEPSVFKHETKKTEGMSNPTNKGKGRQIKNQDFCQVCGEGGKLICCPICPISMHEKCCGMKAVHFGSCSHHQCSVCAKNISGAGGVLFPCESCPNAYCEDCLPKKGVTFLEQDVPRYAKLGFEIPHRYVYIHCSDVCKKIAIDEFNWKAPTRQNEECPEAIDVSYAFGANALSVKDLATRRMNRIAIDEINSHQVIGDVVSDDKDQSGTMNKIAIDQMDPPPVIEVVDSDDNNQVRTKNKDAIDQMDSHPVIEILD